MQISIPGCGELDLGYLVLDFNGTIARDGKLLSNLDRTFEELAAQYAIHVLTADTCGSVAAELAGLPCVVQVIEAGNEAEQKQQYVRSLGADRVVAVGNGANDRLMLQTARLGIAVLEGEGSAVSAIQHADVVARSIYDAMGMLLIPQRLVATLRS